MAITAWFDQATHYGAKYQLAEIADGTNQVARLTIDWLTAYFNHQPVEPTTIPLRPVGTQFQQRVWQALLKIPYGQAHTYRDLAQELNTSPRAVGSAVGHNPISLIIPCHRVLSVDHRLTGYAGGLDRKRFLLDLEGISFKDWFYKLNSLWWS